MGDGVMGGLVGAEVRDGIADLTLDHPPVNALSGALSGALIAALQAAVADPEVAGIVIRAAGRTWPAGADIREFGRRAEAGQGGGSRTPDLTAAVRACPKPVVALMHGTVLGGGLELALAASVRLAVEGTVFGLPEVSLGLLPGAGGTQDLPRLIGPAQALAMMLSGASVDAEQALASGLIDGIVGVDALEVARALAASLAGGPRPQPRAHHAGDVPGWMAAVAAARAGLTDTRQPAAMRIVDCVEAALLLPPDAGRVFERTAFDDLMATPESVALRHAFLSEKRAARSRLLAGAPLPKPKRVAVTGTGPAAAGAALAAISAGIATVVAAPDEAALTEILSGVAAAQEACKAAGTLDQDRLESDWERLTGMIGEAGIAGADLILRSDPGGPLTLGAAVADLGSASPGRGQVGLILTDGSRLAEVIAGRGAAPASLAAVAGLARRAGAVPVLSRQRILPPLLGAAGRAADHLVEAGASPYAVDRALESWGFTRGPYAMRDADPGLMPPREGSLIALVMAEMGARGVHRPGGGVEPEVLALIAAGREAAGIVPRRVAEAEVQSRCLSAMANAAAGLLMADGDLRPSDIDVAMLLGAGYPRWRGGPMQGADQAGLLATRTLLRGYAADDAGLWGPVALWDDLIKEGRRFADLNGD